jgi:8-oxo-dGTP diphosphatase
VTSNSLASSYRVDTLPLDAMWDDARYWLPQILDGEVLSVEVSFGVDNQTVAEHSISTRT